jgi:hypothetical protein
MSDYPHLGNAGVRNVSAVISNMPGISSLIIQVSKEKEAANVMISKTSPKLANIQYSGKALQTLKSSTFSVT